MRGVPSVLSFVVLAACAGSTTLESNSVLEEKKQAEGDKPVAPVAPKETTETKEVSHIAPLSKAASSREREAINNPESDEEFNAPAYGLDNVSRKDPMSGALVCPPVSLVAYQGETIAYKKKLASTVVL